MDLKFQVTDLELAIEHLIILTALKQRIASSIGTEFEVAVRSALREVLEEHQTTSDAIGLGFTIQVKSDLVAYTTVHTPVTHDIDIALFAWSSLASFRAPSRNTCPSIRLQRILSEDLWIAFKDMFLSIAV